MNFSIAHFITLFREWGWRAGDRINIVLGPLRFPDVALGKQFHTVNKLCRMVTSHGVMQPGY